jgi:hypothetical protein
MFLIKKSWEIIFILAYLVAAILLYLIKLRFKKPVYGLFFVVVKVVNTTFLGSIFLKISLCNLFKVVYNLFITTFSQNNHLKCGILYTLKKTPPEWVVDF